jgi:hypothetical protein
MYNMAPFPQQQQQRFGGMQMQQEPMFHPNHMNPGAVRNPFFADQQQHGQGPPQFHPDPSMMGGFMQGPPGHGQGGFPPHHQQQQQHFAHQPQMAHLNNMNQGVQAMSLNNFPNQNQNQYGQGGDPRNFTNMGQQHQDRQVYEHENERFGYGHKRKKDNKTASEEFIARATPGKVSYSYST